MAQKKNPHEGHRNRIRAEYIAHGFDDSTPDHKVLEMLLFYCIPRGDTNEIAHDLLERFGSLPGVFEADASELMKVHGVGPKAAFFLNLMVPITRRYLKAKKLKKNISANSDISEIYEYVTLQYFGKTTEEFTLICFDTKGKLSGTEVLASGDDSEVRVSVRMIIAAAIRMKAAFVVLAHNHPGGFALPSATDLEMTQKIGQALKGIKVGLLDHIIVTEDDYVSLRQSKAYSYLFK